MVEPQPEKEPATSIDEVFAQSMKKMGVKPDTGTPAQETPAEEPDKPKKKKKKKYREIEYDPDRDVTIVRSKHKRDEDDWDEVDY